uniref:Uncharacterized protein n=1 Tax=Romanomermis culicivorax TaxID=13658 RepID=A0A915I9K4_ROMCU
MLQKLISSKRMRMGSETELDKDHMETKIEKLEDQMGTIARTSCLSTLFFFFSLNDQIIFDQKLNNSKKREKVREFCARFLHTEENWTNNLDIQWVGYYNSKKGPRPNIKIDLVQLEDKETIMANAKKLADINKNRKPPIIIAPNLTKRQQDERREKNKGKNPKQK